jgi:DNA polymerase-3 subunit delta
MASRSPFLPILVAALGVVAALNADVKGAAVDPAYALERAVRQIGAARGATTR